MSSYKVLGVSAGGGVSLFVFRTQLLANIELRPIFKTPADKQWRSNFGDIPFINKVGKSLEAYAVQADVLISSPDCGSGSVLRFSRAKKLGNHKENKSLLLFFDMVLLSKVKFFYFENLEGLFKSFPKKDFAKILEDYRLIYHIAPVSAWGNSQITRKRLVVIGIRKDMPLKVDKYFRLPAMGDQTKTCKELYGDLDKQYTNSERVEIAHVREPFDEITTIYAGKRMTNAEIADHWNTTFKNKRRWDHCPGKRFTTAPGVYRNRMNDYPATARKANRQFDHWGYMMSPRQLARIQGVPDNFRIVVETDKLKYWINKGRALVTKTPPYEISIWFKNKLDKLKRKGIW